MTTHLDRLLFAQGGQCFFCRKQLPKAEASVEHLVASANGGTNDDGNCVACCKSLNNLLGSRSIKEKMQIVLNQRGNFQCPGSGGIEPSVPPSSPPAATSVAAKATPAVGSGSAASLDLVLADLKKRGASRPRKVSTLTSTIKALLKQQQKPNSDVEVANLIAELQKRGKVVVTDSKVGYKLG
ncbi:endonuclease [Azonexus hydrophilus]|uniref:Endonuclease n=1 Tax=Azonexus hydrophilus TaxID=418702 RepID=A0A1R1I8G0_9RHOO|nr:HNH endonuclease [Azonexus hydrophilus]OMG55063.1 endonuclease [Azonexus hydrophilus]